MNSRTEISVTDAAEFLKSCSAITLYSHASPDGDTIGSTTALALALQSLGKDVHIFVCDRIPEKLSFIGAERFLTDTPVGTNVSVDIASRNMLGAYKSVVVPEFDMSIDHHQVNSVECEKLLLKNTYVACGEIIFEIINALGVEITKDIAAALYAAISSDSGCFKYSSTRPETYMAAAELLKTGIDFALINRMLFEQKTLTQIELAKAAYNSMRFYLDGKLAVVELDPVLMEALGAAEEDMDNLHDIPRQVKGVEVSALVRVKGNEKKISLRSNNYYDVASFASQNFGGGGHMHAAGCRVPADTPNVGRLLADKLKGTLV